MSCQGEVGCGRGNADGIILSVLVGLALQNQQRCGDLGVRGSCDVSRWSPGGRLKKWAANREQASMGV